MNGVNDLRGNRRMMVTLVACAIPAIAALTACGSSSSSSSPSAAAPATSAATTSAATTSTPATSVPASTSSTPATPASSPSAATAQTANQLAIAANWTTFFDPKAPVAKRIALLENGQQLTAAVDAQAKSAVAASSSAKVVSVSVLSATAAKVTYDILLNGTPVLKNKSGEAILQDGTWKVSTASFCGLLALEGTKSVPAACTSS